MEQKPKYDPQKHHRRSIRLKGYDYSQVGAYFVTICIKDKDCILGKITDGEMYLNAAGLMIDKWWQKIPDKFPDIELGEYQIMPNHFHAIVINVGATPSGRPGTQSETNQLNNRGDLIMKETDGEQLNIDSSLHEGDHVGSLLENSHILTNLIDVEQLNIDSSLHEGDHVGSPLHHVLGWFKTMSTNDYIRNVKQNGWPAFNKKLWQRNYFEHVIRNEKSFQLISNYIYNNPINWQKDKFFAE